MTACVTCYTDRVMTRFLQAKNAKPKPVKGAPGENRAWARLRRRGLNFSPLDKPPSLGRRGCPAVPSLHSLSNVRWGCSARRNRAQKQKRATIYARFCVFLAPRRRGKQPRPETSVVGTAMQDSGRDRAQRGQNNGITQNRA